MKIGPQITRMTSALVIGISILFLVVVFIFEVNIKKTVGSEINTTVSDQLKTIAKDMRSMATALDEMVSQKVQNDLRVAEDVMAQSGDLQLDPLQQVEWSAINQFTKESVTLSLPAMKVGSTWLGQNRSFSEKSPVVDKVQSMVGGTCTIFQRMNKNGDMLRVCTNVKKLDNTRAVGTYIPAVNPNGSKNGVVETVLRGETFYGRAYVVNAWYITAYKPLFNSRGEVVGILYTGEKEEAVESLGKGIERTVVGKSGFVTVFETKGQFAGKPLFHKDKFSKVESLYQITDINGDSIYTRLQEKILKDEEGRAVAGRFVTDKGAVISYGAIYFPRWDWLIVCQTEEDEFMAPVVAIRSALKSMKLVIVLVSIVVIVLSVVISIAFARSVSTPLNGLIVRAREMRDGIFSKSGDKAAKKSGDSEVDHLVEVFDTMADSLSERVALAQSIAGKDLRHSVSLASDQDELGLALKQMNEALNEVLVHIKHNADSVTESSSQLSESSSLISDGAVQSAASVEEISSSIALIDDKLKSNVLKANEADAISQNARKTTDEGNQKMQELQEAMHEITDAASAIEKIIKLIDDIAFQTNLLALNAAVEAARAGNHGKGFAVVAEEVRSLATRSAHAAKETGALIKRSKDAVENGIAVANVTAEKLSELGDEITKSSELFAEVSASTSEQSSAISQISDGLQQIDGVIQNNSAVAEESSSAAMQLLSEAKDLKESIAEFQTIDTEE